MPTFIALLRAVNVGGRSMPMAGLRELLEELGATNPRTLLQSGNAVFASRMPAAALEGALARAIVKRFAYEADVFVRTVRDWDEAIAANPFPKEAKADPAHLVMMPLAKAPSAAHLAALRAAIKGRERVELAGRHAYLVYPDGIGASKLTIAVIEGKLGTRGTARNWNTVLKLAALAADD